MKETANWSLLALVAIVALLLGGFVSYNAFPNTVEVEVPGETVTETVTEYVNVTETIVVDMFDDATADAVAEYRAELEDDDDLLICDGEQYDFDQVTFRSASDFVVTVDMSDEDDTVTTVTFEQKLKFSDKDVESKCYRTDLVTVTFHSDEDEDTEVSID